MPLQASDAKRQTQLETTPTPSFCSTSTRCSCSEALIQPSTSSTLLHRLHRRDDPTPTLLYNLSGTPNMIATIVGATRSCMFFARARMCGCEPHLRWPVRSLPDRMCGCEPHLRWPVRSLPDRMCGCEPHLRWPVRSLPDRTCGCEPHLRWPVRSLPDRTCGCEPHLRQITWAIRRGLRPESCWRIPQVEARSPRT
jgi:hypothetical protein